MSSDPRSVIRRRVQALGGLLLAALWTVAACSDDALSPPTYCEPDLCPEGQACIGNFCTPVMCSERDPCSSGEFCYLFECFPASGSCRDDPCPRLPEADEVVCGPDQYCHVEQTPPPPISGLIADRAVPVSRPSSGETFPAEADVRFTWNAGGAAVVVLVLDAVPAWSGEVLPSAIWGLARAASASPTARWADGVAIRDEVWQAAPEPAPEGAPLYLLVQAVHKGELVAISPLVPFIVGESGWRLPGDACDVTEPEPCANPGRAQTCYQGSCAVLCASSADCAGLPTPLCGLDPETSVRVCVGL